MEECNHCNTVEVVTVKYTLQLQYTVPVPIRCNYSKSIRPLVYNGGVYKGGGTSSACTPVE